MKKFRFEAKIEGTCAIIIEANSKEEAYKMYENGQCGDLEQYTEEWDYCTFNGRGNIYFLEEILEE